MNRGDMQCQWDTDQFPNSIPETALARYAIMQGGGLTTGGINFDAKVRRKYIEPEDMFYGHVGATFMPSHPWLRCVARDG